MPVELLEKVFLGWKLLFTSLAGSITLGGLSYILPLLISLLLYGYVFVKRIQYIRKRLELRIRKNRKPAFKAFKSYLYRKPVLRKLIDLVAIRVSMFTAYSSEKNQEIALVILLLFAAVSIVCLTVILPGMTVVWYVFLIYICLGVFFVLLLFYTFEMTARIRFTSKLPETFKLLNSRYISKGNILKAIAASMDDFDKAVRKEMLVIYDALRKNNMEEIDNTFRYIERVYKNEYLTLLLNLIKQAHYKGGNVVIKQQFEQATEDVLLDIENQRDLAATTRAYILMALPAPLYIKGIELFNKSALGESSAEFYSSPYGIGIKLSYFLLLIGFIAYLLYLERTA